MTDIDRLEDRLTAVERTIIDGDHDFDDLDDVATLADAIERLDGQFDALESRVAQLEARSDSLEGYVTNVDSINEDVTKQAASAVAATESLEERVSELEAEIDSTEHVEKYRPTAGGNADSAANLTDDTSVEQTVDRIVADTDREHTLGTPGDDGQSRTRPEPATPGRGDDSQQNEVRDADPQDVRARFDAQDGTDDHEQNDDDDPDETETSGGFLSSLKDAFS